MVVAYEVDARKDYEIRKKIKTKFPFQKDGLYKCIRLTAWGRYLNWGFRIDEIYYFVGNREPTYSWELRKSVHPSIIFEKIASKVDGDFIEVLKQAQTYYQAYDNYDAFYKWSYTQVSSQ